MKAAPKPLTGVLVFVAYLVVFYGIWIATGVDYDRIGDSASTILKWYVAPLAGGAVVLIIATTWLGWWRPALLEKQKAGPRWLLVGPAFMAFIAIVVLVTKDMSDTTAAMVGLLVVGSIGVGFCEELATRGILIVGFRGSYTETKVWFLSSLLFGLMHLPNWAFGEGPAATSQVALAFMGGTMFYVLRRVTGALIWAMLLHGFFDFASFIGDDPIAVGGVLVIVNGLLALFLVWVLLRREKGQHVPQLGDREGNLAAAV
jgi:membrane protease YdiL (CAAX protease family)